MARRAGVLAALARAQREAERRQAQRVRSEQLAQLARQRASAVDYEQRRRTGALTQTEGLDQVVADLGNVLGATLDVDDYLDLRSLHPVLSRTPFNDNVVSPVGPVPTLSDFLPVGGAVGRLLTSATKRQEQATRAQEQLDRALIEHDQGHRQRADAVERARRDHEQNQRRRTQEHHDQVTALEQLQRDLNAGKPEGVVAYLDLVLERAAYPDGFPHSWQMRFLPTTKQLILAYELPTPDVVPLVKAYRYVKSSDDITATPRPQTQIRAMYASVVAQTALRVVHEILEADRGGQVAEVGLNAMVSATSPATGQVTRECLVSLRATRREFLALNLRAVDPGTCLRHLGAKVSRTPTRLVGVRPLVDIDSVAGGLLIETEAPARPPGFHLEGPTPTSRPTTTPRAPAPRTPATPHPAPPVAPAPVSAVQPRARDGRYLPGAGGSTELQAGQNVALPDSQLDVELVAGTGHDADLSVLLLGTDGRVASDQDFVFFNNPSGAGGAVLLRGGGSPRDCIVNLPTLSRAVTRVVLVASTDRPEPASAAPLVRLQPRSASSALIYRPAGNERVAALVYGELYRRNGAWRFRAVGQGYRDGLAGLARDFGVQVD